MRKKKHKAENMQEPEEIKEPVAQEPIASLPAIIVDEAQELEKIKAQIELEKAKLELQQLKDKISKLDSSREIEPFEQEIVERQISRANEDKAVAAKIRSQKEYDNQMVKGRFINRRAPGQFVKLPYMKYEDDPVKWYTFVDGAIYTIKRGFADQINEYYHTPLFIQKDGPIEDEENPGSQIEHVDRSNKKYAFVGLEYA